MSLLSDKIANTRLTMDAQNKVHSLDEFRSTVNYVNTTNKGYVRFTTKGGNGGLAIEKFNNVTDMPLSWRTNVSSSHNRDPPGAGEVPAIKSASFPMALLHDFLDRHPLRRKH